MPIQTDPKAAKAPIDSLPDDLSALVPFLAAAAAWLIPGAGHILLGRFRRGIIICITVAATFWSGVAVGGVLTVDSREERYWFIAQMLTGVHGAVGWARQEAAYRKNNVTLPEPRLATPSDHIVADDTFAQAGLAMASPADGISRAYTGIAGLMNLMVVFDALMLATMKVRGESPLPGHRGARPASGKSSPSGDSGKGGG